MTTPAERSRESGSALIVVLVALLVLTPLAVLISTLSMSYQRHTTTFRDGLRSRFAVRGGLDRALGRLQAADPPQTIGTEQRFELADAGALPVAVRVSREPDVVVDIEGHVLRARDVSGIDVASIAIDAERRQFHRYRRIESYVVEAETPGSLGNPATRLVASIGRTGEGELVIFGMRYDKALFAGGPMRE